MEIRGSSFSSCRHSAELRLRGRRSGRGSRSSTVLLRFQEFHQTVDIGFLHIKGNRHALRINGAFQRVKQRQFTTKLADDHGLHLLEHRSNHGIPHLAFQHRGIFGQTHVQIQGDGQLVSDFRRQGKTRTTGRKWKV